MKFLKQNLAVVLTLCYSNLVSVENLKELPKHISSVSQDNIVSTVPMASIPRFSFFLFGVS